MSWQTKKTAYQNELDTINTSSNVNNNILELKAYVTDYIASGSIERNDTTSESYQRIKSLMDNLQQTKKRYVQLGNEISTFLHASSKQNNIGTTLKDNGTLQKKIQRLEKIKKKVDDDVNTALARNELLRSRNTNRNSHSLFLLDRPINKRSIPILWMLSILFVGIALVMVQIIMPTMPSSVDTVIQSSIYFIMNVILSRLVLGSLLIACVIVIIFLALKIARVI